MDQEQEMRKAFEFAWLRALGAPDIALRNVLDGKRIMELAWQDFRSTRVESEPLRTGGEKMIKHECMGPQVDAQEEGNHELLPEVDHSRFVLQHKDASHISDSDPLKTEDWVTVEIKREGPVLVENEGGLPTMVIKVKLECDLHVPMDCIEAGTGEVLAQLAGERMVIDLEEDYMPVLADKVQKVLDDWDAKAVAALDASTRVDEPLRTGGFADVSDFDEKDPRSTI